MATRRKKTIAVGDYVKMRASHKWEPTYGMGDEVGRVVSAVPGVHAWRVVVWPSGFKKTYGASIFVKVRPSTREKEAADAAVQRLSFVEST